MLFAIPGIGYAHIVEWAEKSGPSTAGFIDGLMANRPHPEHGFRSAIGVIRLSSRYGPQRLETACARAIAINFYSYKSIESILKHGIDKRPIHDQEPPRANPVHSNIRGPNYYK